MTYDRHTVVSLPRRRCRREIPRIGLVSIATGILFACAGCIQNAARLAPSVNLPADQSAILAFRMGEDPRSGGGNTNLDLQGAINETLSFQLQVCSRRRPIERMALSWRPLESDVASLPTDAIEVFRMVPVELRGFPGWHLRSVSREERDDRPFDVLVPLDAPSGGLPERIDANQFEHLWVDIHIPKGSPDGRFTTRIDLSAGGRVVGSVQVSLTVWPFVLPDQPLAPTIAELDHERLLRHHLGLQDGQAAVNATNWASTPDRPARDRLLRETMQLLQKHRVTPVLHRLVPAVTVDGQGRPVVDWAAYDQLVAPFVDGDAFRNRLPARYWPLPASSMLARADIAAASPDHVRLIQRYLSEAASHFQERGWLDRSYVALPPSDRLDRDAFIRDMSFARSARKVEPRVRALSRLWPQDLTPYGWVDYPGVDFDPPVDVWMPPAQFFDAAAMAQARRDERETWFAPDRPPFGGSIAVSAPPAYARVIGWQAATTSAQATYLGCVNAWPDDSSASSPEACVRFNSKTLLYPGTPFGLDFPVASVRLKHLHAGLQDAAYRRLLLAHELNHIARTLTESLVARVGSDAYRTHFADGRPVGWVETLSSYEQARALMADALLRSLDGDREPTRAEDLAQTTRWRRFMLDTRRIRLDFDGARARLWGPRRSSEAVIDFMLTVTNDTRKPLQGVVRFASLPDEWQVEQDRITVGPIPPGRSRQVVLAVRTATLPASASGTTQVPIVFDDEDGNAHTCHATASMITAVPLGETIRVDGDLSDWPPGAANVASGFRPIATRRPSLNRRPGESNQTLVFTMRDADALYVAIHCRHHGVPASSSRLNTVAYDDLVPVGGELVELLIDPLNAGTRSPDDLFHVAIKPTGSYVVEKGLPLNPPVGRRRPWAADITVATSIESDRWYAELRIPLASFDSFGTDHVVWGFNVTRFDAGAQMLSTWSGAVGNAYDPMSLGNLFLP